MLPYVALMPYTARKRVLAGDEIPAVVPYHDAALHHEADRAQRVDILNRICVERDDVRELAGADPADVGFHVQHTSGTRGRRLQRLQRRHSRLHVQLCLRNRRVRAIVRLEMTLAPGGIGIEAEGPTWAMRSPDTMIVALSIARPPSIATTVPPTSAVTDGAAGAVTAAPVLAARSPSHAAAAGKARPNPQVPLLFGTQPRFDSKHT